MKKVRPDGVIRLMTKALLRRGLSQKHADQVARGLATTSLRGVDTHGIILFPLYLKELEGGRAKAQPQLSWHKGAAATRVLDADGALGLVAGLTAAEKAVHLARSHGVGAVAVGNSNHFGAASVYTLAMAAQGMIGLSFSNSDALVAPTHGKNPLFGTNPLSFAVEGDGEVFCVDMATSQVAYSRVKRFKAAGKPLQPGWALDGDGRDLADSEGEFAAMQPLGGYKGQCLCMMVEILCVLLTGMPFDHELSHLFVPPYDRPRTVSHFFLALDISSFQSLAGFKTRLSRLLTGVREAERSAETRVINPGDLEKETADHRRLEGIPVPDHLYRELSDINRELGSDAETL